MNSTNQPIIKRGLHNWKNLFRKPNGYEVTIFIMLILGGMLAYSYKAETQTCRTVLNNLDTIACEVCSTHETVDRLNSQQDLTYSNTSLILKNFSVYVAASTQSNTKE